jgi:triosephosphate isomerase (TIM)
MNGWVDEWGSAPNTQTPNHPIIQSSTHPIPTHPFEPFFYFSRSKQSMLRKKVVAGNWKMNTDFAEAKKLMEEIVSRAPRSEVLKIIFPPFPFLSEISAIAKAAGIKTGAQNCSEQEKGAYTGEVSAKMIASCGAEFCLIGHSERRQYFSESSKQLAKKIEQCLNMDLSPVFCVGEKLEERKSGIHFKIVEEQVCEVLEQFSADAVSKMLLAYEPVWAIGTGETASSAQAGEMHAFIRTLLRKLKGDKLAAMTPVLYGGSCNAQNAAELFHTDNVDGGLIGGASLKAEDFATIMKSFSL